MKKLILLSPFLFIACTTESEQSLSETPTTTEFITYNAVVKQIMTNNCISCHGNVPSSGAPNSLTTYENVRDAVLNAELIERISRAQGMPGQMPLGGSRLPQTTIDKVIAWKDQGFKK